MKDELKKLCLPCIVIALVTLLFNIGFKYAVRESESSEDTYVTSDGEYMKTVAHLEVDETLWECISIDYDEDIAYYHYIGDKKLLKTGDIVTNTFGKESSVIDTNANGFRIEYSSEYVSGMSGQNVYDEEGNPVGIISTIVYDEYVYCIWN